MSYKKCVFPPTISVCLRSDSACAKLHVGVLASDVLMEWPQEKPIKEGGKQHAAGRGLGRMRVEIK